MSESQIFERFDCAPGLRLQAHEQLAQLHYDTLNRRLERLELAIERVERRLWLAVFGVVAAVMAEGIESLIALTP